MANSTTSTKGSSTSQDGNGQSGDRVRNASASRDGRQSAAVRKEGAGEERGGGDGDDADLLVPMKKVSPVVWAAVGVAALGIVGGVVYVLSGRSEPPKVDYESAIQSAQIAADKAKAEQQQRIEHLQQAQKAWQIASEQQAAQAASSGNASGNATDNVGKGASSLGQASGATAGQGKVKPKSGARASDLEQLDKLGSAVNSELGK